MINTETKKDLRYIQLKKGLEQLSITQLQKILDYKEDMVFDIWNFDEENKLY
jgi:hypothetical protein